MRRAEVDNPNFTVVRDKNVSRIEVAMHYPARMGVRNRSTHIPNDG
jgi:hypothetical protein